MGRYFFKDLGDGSFWLSTIPLSGVGLLIFGWFAFFMVPDIIANPKILTCGSGAMNGGPVCDEKDWLAEWNTLMQPEENMASPKASFDGAGNLTLTLNSPSEDYYYSSGADVVDALYGIENFMYADYEFIKTTTVVVKVDGKKLASGTWTLDDIRKTNAPTYGEPSEYVDNLYFNKKLQCSKPNCDNQR